MADRDLPDLSMFLGEYLNDAKEDFQVANQALLALEKDPSQADRLNEVFRAVHTLKSSSAMLEFTSIAALAHLTEDLLDRIRSKELPLNPSAIDVLLESGRRVLKHAGEVGGFTAENRIYPDDGIAIVVLTNEDATDAFDTIADELAELMLVSDSPADAAAVADAKHLFSELQRGRIDPAHLTSNARSYFSTQARADFKNSLGPLGKPVAFTLKRSARRGGLITRVFEVSFADKKLSVVVRALPEGLIEQYTVSAK